MATGREWGTQKGFDDAFSPDKVSQIDEGLASGAIREDMIPGHIQGILRDRGSQHFATSEDAYADQADDYDTEASEDDGLFDFTPEDLNPSRKPSSPQVIGPKFVRGLSLSALAEGDDQFFAALDFMRAGGTDYDPDSVEQAGANLAKEQSIKDNEEILDNFVTNENDINAVVELAQVVQEENRKIVNADPTRLWLDLNSDVNVEPMLRAEATARMKVGELMGRAAENLSFGVGAVEVLSSFVPFVDTIRQKVETGSVWESEDWAKEMHRRFWSEDPEEQSAAIQELEEEVLPLMLPLRQLEFLEYLSLGSDSSKVPLDWTQFNPILDFGTLGLTSAVSGVKAVRQAMAAGNLIRNLKTVNPSAAADLNTAALISKAPEAQEATAGSTAVATINATPFKAENLVQDATDGLSAQTMRRINDFEAETKEVVDGIISGETALVPGYISDSQKNLIRDNLLTKYQKTEGIDNVTIVSRDNEFHITFDRIDKDGNVVGDPVTEIYTGRLDDLGSFDIKDQSVLDRYFHSPMVAWKETDLATEAMIAQRLDSTQAKIFNELTNMQRRAVAPIIGKFGFGTLNPIRRKQLKELSEVLMKGNQNQEVYTIDQLTSGVLGYKFNDAQVESYFNVRNVMDGLYYLRNHIRRNEEMLKGHRQIEVTGADGKTFPYMIRPYRDKQAAESAIRSTGRKKYFDSEEGDYFDLDTLDLDNLYSNGYTLGMFSEPVDAARKGDKVYFAVVRADEVKDLPMNIIPYTKGYVPQISKNAVYFAKVRSRTSIDGEELTALNPGADTKTVREFDNRTDAEAWVHQQNLEARQRGVSETDEMWLALEDNQLERERAVSGLGHSFGGTGGLFTGARSQDEILFGLEGKPREMVNSFEAISHNLASLAKYSARNEWRLGMEARAVETANELLGTVRFRSFEELRQAPETDNGRLIKAMYTQIRDWTGMPTSSELAFQNGVRRMLDSAVGKKVPGMKNLLLSVRQSDPVGAMRAGAFHPMLGWFNVRQLWVQAQGAAVALSMNILRPDNLARVMRDQTALMALGHMKGTPKQISMAAKASGVSTDYLTTLYDAWKRSGLEDSVLTTADHAAAMEGKSMSMDMLGRAASGGMLFYRAGELTNRRISFATAFLEQVQKAGGFKKFEMNDKVLGEIIDRTNNFMLNLSKGNRSAWQRGPLSLTFQFNQITQKAAESVLGMNDAFTAAERFKLLAGQVALYGSAGIPLGGLGATILASAMGWDTQAEIEQNMTPEMVKLVNEGFVGWTWLKLFDADSDVSPSSSLAQGIESILDTMLFEETTLLEKLLGASGTVMDRFLLPTMGLPKALALTYIGEGTPIDYAKVVANPFLSTLSSWNNAQKAMFMADHGRITDSQGNDVVRRDFTTGEILSKALGGFDTRDYSDYFRMNRVLMNRQDYRKKLSAEIVNVYHQAATKAINGTLTDEDIDNVQASIAFLTAGLNQFEMQQVRESVRNSLSDTKNKAHETWTEYRKVFGNGTMNNLIDMRAMVDGNFSQLGNVLTQGGLFRQGTYDREISIPTNER